MVHCESKNNQLQLIRPTAKVDGFQSRVACSGCMELRVNSLFVRNIRASEANDMCDVRGRGNTEVR